MKSKSGFTLIELLVVVAIISLLASVVMASLNSARSKARDAKRREDIHQLQLALNLYLDANGVYPPDGGAVNPNAGWANSAEAVSWGAGSTFQTAIAPYMSKLPVDPQNLLGWITNAYYYAQLTGNNCNGKAYMLIYKLENGANVPASSFTACDGTLYQYGGAGSGIVTMGEIGF